MKETILQSGILARWGPLQLTLSIVTTWGVMVVLIVLAGLARRASARADGGEPTRTTLVLEAVMEALESSVAAVLPAQAGRVAPFLGTLGLLILASNLTGLLPGLHSPTSDLSVTAALAVVVFFSVHWFGIQSEGWRRYLRHYLSPSPLLLPFHLVSEVSRTLALAIRLFGNMMSLDLAAYLVLLIAGLAVPVPLLMLHIVEAVIQAWLFAMLALIYIAGGIQSRQPVHGGEGTAP